MLVVTRGKKNVVGFDVQMDVAALVNTLESVNQLEADLHGGLVRQTGVFEPSNE